MRVAVLLAVLTVLASASVGTAYKTYDVTSYGAVGDGKTKNTKAVRMACSDAAAAGGGTVLFPYVNGKADYVTGAFNLSSNTHLEVQKGVTVSASDDGSDFPLYDAPVVWPQFGHGSDCDPGTQACTFPHQGFVFSWSTHNVSIGGGGVIDGRGHSSGWYDCAGDLSKSPCSGSGRPHLLDMMNVTGLVLENVNFTNSPDWSLHISSCTDVYVNQVSVTAPSDSPNTDGIDVDSSWNVLVENSYFATGDDALCVKSGIDYFGRLYGRPAKNVTFSRIQIGSGHGISIGSETSGGVEDVLFEDIVMHGTDRGPRLKSQRGRGGVVQNITYRNIVAYDLQQQAISVTLNYHKLPPTNASATPVFKNVLMDGLTFIYSSDSSPNAGIFEGLDDSQLSGFTLKNITMPSDAKWQDCYDVTDSSCDDVTVCPPCF